jgi:hypothetical protein
MKDENVMLNKLPAVVFTTLISSLFFTIVFTFNSFNVNGIVFSFFIYSVGIITGVLFIGLPLSILTHLFFKRLSIGYLLALKLVIYESILGIIFIIYYLDQDSVGLLLISTTTAFIYWIIETMELKFKLNSFRGYLLSAFMISCLYILVLFICLFIIQIQSVGKVS